MNRIRPVRGATAVLAVMGSIVAIMAVAVPVTMAETSGPSGGARPASANANYSAMRAQVIDWQLPNAALQRPKVRPAVHRASRSQARRPLSGDPRDIARAMVAQHGWSADQFTCLDALWTKESHWQLHASNPGSGAYGIPQALPGSKMASAGPDWQNNAATQISWGLGYIAQRYGTPCAAWDHSQATNYY